jgi:hypothetical protein
LNIILNEYDSELRAFGAKITKDIHLVDMEVYYFQSNFYTKKNTISKTSGDVDNPNKILVDEIFKRIGWDDYILGKLSCEKLPSDKDKVVIRMSTYRLPECPKDLLNEIYDQIDKVKALQSIAH